MAKTQYYKKVDEFFMVTYLMIKLDTIMYLLLRCNSINKAFSNEGQWLFPAGKQHFLYDRFMYNKSGPFTIDYM